MKTNTNTFRNRHGVTLIELLVVISILAIITAYLIPKVRMISADRDIRETARVVGSVFNSAAQRAIAEGGSGVVIITNGNIIDNNTGGSVFYAGQALYQMRSVPPYTGDASDALATKTMAYELTIDQPFEHEPSENRFFIKIGDYIRVNNSSLRYRIVDTSLMGTTMTLTLDNENYTKPNLPGTAGTTTFPFLIERQPRALRSSRVDLPKGYMIDMRYSGPTQTLDAASPPGIMDAVNGTAFNQEIERNIVVLFAPDGSIDRVVTTAQPGAVNPVFALTNNGRLSGALHLLIAEDDPNAKTLTIQRNESLWVTVGNNTGTVNIGINNATDGGDPTVIDGLLQPIYPLTTINRASILFARRDAGGYGALQ